MTRPSTGARGRCGTTPKASLSRVVHSTRPNKVVILTGNACPVRDTVFVSGPLAVHTTGTTGGPLIHFGKRGPSGVMAVTSNNRLVVRGVTFSKILRPNGTLTGTKVSATVSVVRPCALAMSNYRFRGFKRNNFFTVGKAGTAFTGDIAVGGYFFHSLSKSTVGCTTRGSSVNHCGTSSVLVRGYSFCHLLNLPVGVCHKKDSRDATNPCVAVERYGFTSYYGGRHKDIVHLVNPRMLAMRGYGFSGDKHKKTAVHLSRTA